MDSFTQIVLGAAVGEAILGKKVGNKAILWGGMAGTIPDLDVLGAPFMSDISALAFHRGISHSLLFGILFPFLIGWLPIILHKKYNAENNIRYLDWVYLFIGSILTHPLLDAFTSYGTQLFLPFSDYRVAFNTVSIVDPLYTVPFLFCLIMASFYSRSDQKRRRWNWLGLGLSCGYLAYTVGVHQYVHHIIDKNLNYEQMEYSRYTITPTLFNSSLWNVIVEHDQQFTMGLYSIWDSKPQFSDRIEISKNHELISDLRNTHEIKTLEWFTNNYYSVHKNADQLILSDMRYGRVNPDEDEPKFVFTFNITPVHDGVEVQEIRAVPKEPKKLLALIWERAKGR